MAGDGEGHMGHTDLGTVTDTVTVSGMSKPIIKCHKQYSAELMERTRSPYKLFSGPSTWQMKIWTNIGYRPLEHAVMPRDDWGRLGDHLRQFLLF